MKSWNRSAGRGYQVVGLCLSILGTTGCANTPWLNRDTAVALATGGDDQPVPHYVRNLPKAKTGNMASYTVFGKRYRVMDSAAGFTETGVASWYGKKFHGRKTSSGDIYNMNAMTAAHKHLPLPTYVRVVNLDNGRSTVVLVNDRGPFVGNRIIDMSYAGAQALGMVESGTANVSVEALSTHHIAENESIQRPTSDAPNSIEPTEISATVNAVPLQEPLVVIGESEPEPISGEDASRLALDDAVPGSTGKVATSESLLDSELAIVTEEDGFVEQPGLATGLVDELVVSEPVKNDTLAEQGVVMAVQNTPAFEGEESDIGSFSSDTVVAQTLVLQLGAFSKLDNANALIADIADQTGLPAYVERDATARLFRVKMGPFQQGSFVNDTIAELASRGIDSFALQTPVR